MVRRLSALMGGSAGVTSVVGEGSCFWFTLAPAPEGGGATASSAPAALGFPPGFSIVIVEDTPILLRMMQHQLARLDCNGVFLNSGQEVNLPPKTIYPGVY